MYKSLIQKIKTTFLGIDAVKGVYAKYLEGSIKTFPAVQFAFSDSDNTWETNCENKVVLNFNVIARFSLSGITEANDTNFYENTIPNFIDKVFAEFETNWGSYIEVTKDNDVIQHKMWWILNNRQPYVDVLEKNKEVIIPFSLTVKVNKDIS